MIPKSQRLSAADKHDFVNADSNVQYNNLNLNQNHNFHNVNSFITKTFSTCSKNKNATKITVPNVYPSQTINHYKSWDKSDKVFSPKPLQSLKLYDSSEVNQKQLNKYKTDSNATKSTLSLHIAAYENSIEVTAAASDSHGQVDFKKKLRNLQQSSKQWKDGNNLFESNTIISLFEFPRQQENEAMEPEVMRFRASQKLMNFKGTKKVVMEKKDVSEKDAKRLKEAVGQLSKLVSNSICADCHQQRSLWASVNFGVFLCSRCAGMHRHLGVHITQVRSINLDTWTPLQLLCVTINGNMWTNSWLLSNKSPDYGRHIVDDPSMSRFIQEKYESMKYGDNSGILLVTKSNFPYITVEKALEVYKLAMTLHRQQVDHCLIRPQLIAAAGFDYAVPKNNPGNRKLLLVMEDSRGGDQKHITQAHISGIPQGKKPTLLVIPSFKTTSHQLGHTASESNIRVTNFIDIDDFGVGESTTGIARVNISGDSMEKPTHPPSKSSSFGVFPTEGHDEPAWPSVNATSGDNLNSFFKEPRALQPNLSASEQGFFGSFKSSADQNRNDKTDSIQNTFIPNFDLAVNERNSDNDIPKSNNDNSNGTFFIENILGPTSSTPAAANNGFGDFAIPSMAPTPFSHNTVSSSNGNPAKKDCGDATQDKDFILSLYSK